MEVWGLLYLLFHLPIFLTIFFSTTRHSVFATAALVFLHGRQRILKATITAQNYQFPLQLTLWEERGQGRGRRAEKGMRDSNLGMKRANSVRSFSSSSSSPPCSPLQGVVMGLGWGGRELHLLRMNLTPPLNIQHRPPILITSK